MPKLVWVLSKMVLAQHFCIVCNLGAEQNGFGPTFLHSFAIWVLSKMVMAQHFCIVCIWVLSKMVLAQHFCIVLHLGAEQNGFGPTFLHSLQFGC
jgi:hypothetical protein